MPHRPQGAPDLHPPTASDITTSLALGWQDFRSAPMLGLFFSSFYVIVGMLMAWITYRTGHTFWLILAVMGFPLVGAFAALGLYEISRRRMVGEPLNIIEIAGVVWSHKNGQLPWFAVIIVVAFLFWFFLGHMIFALFLGLAPMTNVLSAIDVFLTPNGLAMLGFGTAVGAVFSILIFSICVQGLPMLLDRNVDFVTALITSIAAVKSRPLTYLAWGGFIALVTILSMLPYFLGLFVTLPIFGHASWHLYKRTSSTQPVTE